MQVEALPIRLLSPRLAVHPARIFRLKERRYRKALHNFCTQRGHMLPRSTSGQENADLADSSFGDNLVEWISANGGKVAAVGVVKEASGTWGLHACQDCPKDTVLINLPNECVLTFSQTSDPCLLALIDQVPDELWGGKLSLKLLYERAKGDDSFYLPYLRSLPIGVPGLPIFYTGNVLKELQYPPVLEQVKMRCRWIANFASKNIAAVRGSEIDPFRGVAIDMNGLGWSLGVVSSRAFRVNGPGKPASMLPLIDMCNHSFEPNCQIIRGKSGVALVALADIKNEQPLLLNYGKLPNDFLLLDYGFVVRNNPYDTVQLRFDVGMVELGRSIGGLSKTKIGKGSREDGSIELYSWQIDALATLGLAGRAANLQMDIGGSAVVDPRLLAAVRILFLPDESMIKNKDLKSLGTWDNYINAENEVKTLRTLAGLLASVTSQFATSLEEDQTLLMDGQLDDPNFPLVLTLRIEKKIILMQALMHIGNQLKALQESTEKEKGGENTGPSTKNTPGN